jgi:hybrid cluster-associated redox disulfide protein
MSKKQKITKEMKISEIAEKYPQTLSLFLEKGLHCIGCPIAQDENLEEAAKVHDLDLEKLLEELNEIIKK